MADEICETGKGRSGPEIKNNSRVIIETHVNLCEFRVLSDFENLVCYFRSKVSSNSNGLFSLNDCFSQIGCYTFRLKTGNCKFQGKL